MKSSTSYVKDLLFFILSAVITFEAQAAEYDFSVALQLEPTMYAHKKFINHSYDKVSPNQLQEIVTLEALNYFTKVKSFSPVEPANFFIRLQLTYGSYYRMDGYESSYPENYCISLKYESEKTGISVCDDDSVKDAIETVFDKFTDKEEKLLQSINVSKRKIVWLDAVDKGIVYDKNNKPGAVQEGFLNRGGFKQNTRALLSLYFQDKGKEPINFFKSEDLISVIMNSRENINKHEQFLIEIINKTRKRHRMWPFYMHQAVRANAPFEIIQAIGTKKSNYDKFLDDDGNTPLMNAIWSANLKLAKFFIDSGSNPKLKNKQGIGIIHYAATLTPFRKDFEILDFALKQGVNINDVSKQGVQPLAMAVMFNSSNGNPIHGTKLVNAFKKRGSAIDMPKKARSIASSALAQAVYYKDHTTGKRLLELGANIEHHVKDRETPLQLAAANNDLFFVKALLKAGAKTNVIGPDNKTALHYAYPKPEHGLSADMQEIIGLLKQHGANTSIKDNTGKTAEQSYNVAREAYLEEQRILAHNKRMRELKAERERQAREEQARQQRAAEAKRNKGGFNWGKAMAMGAGFLAGGGLHLDAGAQAETIMGIVQDSQEGVEGMSNSTSALNNATQRYKKQNAAKRQTSSIRQSRSSNGGSPAGVLDRYGNYNPACNNPNVQVNSFCQTANAYYDQYVKFVQSGQGNGKHLYKIHKRTVRQMMEMQKNSKNRTTLKLGGSSKNGCTQPSGHAANDPDNWKAYNTCRSSQGLSTTYAPARSTSNKRTNNAATNNTLPAGDMSACRSRGGPGCAVPE